MLLTDIGDRKSKSRFYDDDGPFDHFVTNIVTNVKKVTIHTILWL